MLTVAIDENDELIIEGELVMDEIYPNWCCPGWDYIISGDG